MTIDERQAKLRRMLLIQVVLTIIVACCNLCSFFALVMSLIARLMST